jgi:hypothetical protein
MPKVLTPEHKLKMQEGQRKARAARKALAEAAQEAGVLYDDKNEQSQQQNYNASYNTGTGVPPSYRRIPVDGGATADIDPRRTGQHRGSLRVVAGRERDVSGSDQLSAGATGGSRTDTTAPDYRNQRAATGDYRAASIASRLQDGIARAGNAVLDRVSSIGKSSEEETEQEDAEEDDSEPAGIVRAFETWRDEHGGILTDKEAEERREDLIDKLVFYSGQMDRFLTISNTQHAESQLWQLSPKEAKPLANIWLRRARKNVNVAVSLRAFMDGDEYVQAAVVLVPRLAGTGLWWQRHGGFNLESWQQ